MATVFGAKDGRLATGATVEPSAAERGRAGRKRLDDGRAGRSCSREGTAVVRSRAARCHGSRQWSLTTLREKLVKIGAKVARHAKYVTLQTGGIRRAPATLRFDPQTDRQTLPVARSVSVRLATFPQARWRRTVLA